jgi:hypothetical protein
VSSPEDVSEGDLFIEIILNQIFARYISANTIKNIFTLRNIVEDSTRMMVDVAGYYHGYAYDVDIEQLISPDGKEKYVYGIDAPVLSGICEQAGVSIQNMIRIMAGPAGYFLRHALADTREAIKAPKDTGFFCYRAIEALKNYCVMASKVSGNEATKWHFFRERFSIPQQTIMEIKSFGDPVRHGNYVQSRPISDSERAFILTRTWSILNKFILEENSLAPRNDSAAK